MRILQIIPVFSPFFGGAVSVVRNISRELAKKHDVSVYTTTRYTHETDLIPKQETIDGYRVNYFKRNLRGGFLGEFNFSFDFMKAFRENISNFDVIHLHSWRQFEDYVVCKYAPMIGIPYVLHVHGTLVKTNKRAIKQIYELAYGKKLLRNASRVIAISSTEAKQFSELGIPAEKISVVHNGLNLERYSKMPPSGVFKKQFNINDETKIILYLGRVDPTKGIDFLLNAFAYATQTAGLKKVKLIIVGPDFGFLTKARALVKQLGLSNNVLFTGMLPEADKLSAYVDADLVVYPEIFNVWGLVVLEAAACGKPVIVSETNHMSNIVKKGKFGFVVKYGDVKSFGILLSNALVDENSLKTMGLVGKQFVHDNFSWQNSALELEKIYSTLTIKEF